MNVVVHIERLVLHDVELRPHEREALQASFERELARHVEARGINDLPRHGAAVSKLDVPAASSQPQTPEGFGRDLARAVYFGIAGAR